MYLAANLEKILLQNDNLVIENIEKSRNIIIHIGKEISKHFSSSEEDDNLIFSSDCLMRLLGAIGHFELSEKLYKNTTFAEYLSHDEYKRIYEMLNLKDDQKLPTLLKEDDLNLAHRYLHIFKYYICKLNHPEKIIKFS